MDTQEIVWKKEPVKPRNVPVKQNPPGTSTFRKLDNNNDHPIPVQNLSVDYRKMIQQARLNAKLTQAELAKKMNIKVSDLAAYENGKAVPPPSVLVLLKRVLA